ncbi:MAG: alcohol dehydrogenase [Sporomusa sp.]|jgi:threonine dehydrogenase-like Zn-dependent dehydrogenase|nr:alcohol dehydrogenase [Sporomusa sp.]
MKTKAMVLREFCQPLEIAEIEIPVLAEGQVLIKLAAAGVCGSDVHISKGEDPRTPLPIILGHEGVGTVIEVKGNKQTLFGEVLRPGDLVMWNRGLTCGGCYYCTILNQPWLCIQRKTYGINRSLLEAPQLNGCYADHIILTANTDIFKLEGITDPAVFVSASCSGATVAHAFDLHEVKFGDTVLVQGPGPLGVYASAYAKRMGAAEVFVIGGTQSRLELCKEFGATMLLNRKTMSAEERCQAIMDKTDGRGVDVIIEAVGDPAAVREGLNLLRFGGAYLSVGFSQPPGECQVDFFREVVRKNAKIQGVWVSGAKHTWQSIQLVKENQEAFAKMVTHRFALEDANKALEVMENRQALKAVLIP